MWDKKLIKKCGYVGVIGKTNVGKSTLVNALVGEKVAIVSPKTQTTQRNITGILTQENAQIIFMDTPGIHKSQNYLDRKMMKNVREAIGSVDVLLYIFDGTKKLDKNELDYISKFCDKPIIVGISKIDLVPKWKLVEILTEVGNLENILTIIPFSNKNRKNYDIILTEIIKNLPMTREFIYDKDLYTDNSVRFMCAEIIREKCLLLLNEELPHGIKIDITKFDENDEKITFIETDLICEKDSHKAIILGKGGSKTKEIATLARKDMEDLLNKKVMLKIWVKVIKNWRQNENVVV